MGTGCQTVAAARFDAADAFRGNVGMADKYLQSLAWDRIMQDRFRSGELPRWTNDIGGGAPFVPQMAQPWQPINALLLLVPSEQWYGWWYLIHQVLFGWFAYTFFRRLGCLHPSALLGLVVAVLGIWTQCKVHHNVILTAALSLWPMLSATHELLVVGARNGARRRAIAWLALWTGLSWSTGFVVVALQVTYLTLAMAALWTLQAERGERLRRLLPFGVGLALGAALSLANMLPVLAAAAASARPPFDAALQQEGSELQVALGEPGLEVGAHLRPGGERRERLQHPGRLHGDAFAIRGRVARLCRGGCRSRAGRVPAKRHQQGGDEPARIHGRRRSADAEP